MSKKVINIVVGGGSEYMYFSLNGEPSQYADVFASSMKIRTEDGIEILSTGAAIGRSEETSEFEILACCIDLNLKITLGGELKKLKDLTEYINEISQTYLPITEEEFYDLTQPTE